MVKTTAMMAMVLGFCSATEAGDINKADNATALNLPASWVGGMVPEAADTAVYTGLGAWSTALGADLEWSGIAATNNSGVWTITGANTLTLGAGGITTGGGTTGGLAVNAPVNQAADAGYDIGSGRNVTFGSSLSGTGSITKIGGGGALILRGDGSAYSGTITLSKGLISVGSDDSALGTGSLILNGGLLNAYATDRVATNPVMLTADSQVEAVTTSRNLTLSGVVSGGSDAALTVRGAGYVTLSGDNTFSGGVNLGLTAGTTLVAGHNNALGTGIFTLSGNGGKLGTIASTVLANDISLNATLDVVSANVLTVSGVMSGSGNLLKSGSGNLVLTRDNSGFSGAITHRAGVLSIGHDAALGTGVLTMDGGILNAYSTDRTLANDIVIAGNSKFEAVNTSRDLVLTGEVSGSGAVTKVGIGTVTLRGTCTYSNTTAVSAGTLQVDGVVSDSQITVAGNAVLSGSGEVGSVTMQSGSVLYTGNGSNTLTFGGTLTLEAGSSIMMEIPGDAGFDVLESDGNGTIDAAGDFIFDFSGNSTVQEGDAFAVLQGWNTFNDNGVTAATMGLDDGLTIDISRLALNGSITVVANDPVSTVKATGLLYAGIYTGTNMTPGIYTFTDPAQPLETATRVGQVVFPSATYRDIGFDGEKYIMVNRASGKLYENNGATSLFTLLSGSYSYSEWHGVERCNGVYYGIYNGSSSSMEGQGLYVFYDPSDPEGTCVKICTNQVFSSNVWTDVAFDGERYLFVRTDAEEGTPGIYQYDPDSDRFSLISGAETYGDWEGLAVFDSDIAPLLNRKVYLLLFGGQSNALGWGYHQYLLDTNDPLQLPQDDIELLYRKPYASAGMLQENTLLPLQSGNSNTQVKQPGEYPALTNAPISRFGPELSFARTVRDRINIPNAKVAVVKYAVGGSSLWSHWHPDSTANRAADGLLYRTFQETVWRCIAALRNKYPYHEVAVLGMGWVQGESDAIEGHETEYASNLTSFIADIRLTFGTNITFVLSKLSPNQDTDPKWTVVRNAQQAVADADPKVEATSTEGTNYLTSVGLSEGVWHFKTSSLLQIGRDLGNALMDTCGLDSDSDGIPDSWENSYPPGTGGLGNTPEADYDQDGQTDREEFRIGTSPVDPSDRLTVFMDTSMMGHWAARKDIAYQALKSADLVSWVGIGNPVLLRNDDGEVEFNFSQYVQIADTKGFFKLLVE